MWRMSRDLRGNRSRMHSPIRSRMAAEQESALSAAPWVTASNIGYEWNQVQVVRPMSPIFHFLSHTSRQMAIAAMVLEAVLSRPAIYVTFCCYNSGRATNEKLDLTVSEFIGWRDATAVRSQERKWHSRASTLPKSWAWRTIRRHNSDKKVDRSASHLDYHPRPRRESSRLDRHRIRLSRCQGRILTRRKHIGTWNKQDSQWNLPTTDCNHLIKGCRAHDSPSKTLEYPMRRHWIWDTHLEAHLRHNPHYHRLQVNYYSSVTSINPYLKLRERKCVSKFDVFIRNFYILFYTFQITNKHYCLSVK